MKVFMYTLSTCPWCRKTKQFFREKNIPFEYVDYDLADEKEQDRILDELSRLNVTHAFPVVMIDANIVVGYNPEKYIELLDKGKQK